jgi:hypothetical protein
VRIPLLAPIGKRPPLRAERDLPHGVDTSIAALRRLFRILRGGSDVYEIEDVCNSRRSGGGRVKRGYGPICLSSRLCVCQRRLPTGCYAGLRARAELCSGTGVPASAAVCESYGPVIRRGGGERGRSPERRRSSRSCRCDRWRRTRHRYRRGSGHNQYADAARNEMQRRVYLLQRRLCPSPLARLIRVADKNKGSAGHDRGAGADEADVGVLDLT